MSRKVRIIEVGPRDGLQNEVTYLDEKQRLSFVKKLAQTGLKNIEVGAFVSPKWVPQMNLSHKVVAGAIRWRKSQRSSPKVQFSALVPNLRGMQDAMATQIKEVAVFGACSESFSKKNINCSISESFARFTEVVELAKAKKVRVRGYLSTAFGCPYEGAVPVSRVVRNIERLFSLGVYEVSIGDTIGVASPRQVRQLLEKLEGNGLTDKVAMHFHDTRGTALANVLESIEGGVRSFDSSLGGLGGCPYAKGASGNLATEDLIYMLHGMGYKTGVDLKKLLKIKPWIEEQVGRSLPSRVGQAGLPLPGTIKGL